MSRKIYLAFILFTCVCIINCCSISHSIQKGFSLGPYSKSHCQVLRKIENSTVIFQSDNHRWSGVAISPDGMVMTAFHGLVRKEIDLTEIKDSKLKTTFEVRVRGNYGEIEFEDISVISVFPKLDLAVIDIGIPTPSYLSASNKGPREKDVVFLVGASSHIVQIAAGYYFAYSEANEAACMERASLWVDGPAFNGDSGGAITNEKGDLLGIITSSCDPKKLLSMGIDDPEVLHGRSYIIIATALPSQLFMEIINSKTRINNSSSMGNVEKNWNAIFLSQPVGTNKQSH
jgi:hypothetical protein